MALNRLFVYLPIVVVLTVQNTIVMAQDLHVLSLNAQRVAAKVALAESIGLKPDDPLSLRRYLDYLAAADVIGRERASIDDRKLSDSDIEAALVAECFWPPYKPPVESWIKVRGRALAGAYISLERRERIRRAVGPLALKYSPVELARELQGMSAEEFQKQVLDYSQLLE